MDLVNNYIYILEIPINIISKLRSYSKQMLMRKESAYLRSLFLFIN